ncbi:hypothetical protein L6452_14866 [Arctium lappa]|uniref:Uncharacterized protein n=1 Tax=Arctium lappa TaxID=4217 RepID=A0ACB9CM62_ARCLA|nr:hypothetical protein L6452_14866 [Arctium lappa]
MGPGSVERKRPNPTTRTPLGLQEEIIHFGDSVILEEPLESDIIVQDLTIRAPVDSPNNDGIFPGLN